MKKIDFSGWATRHNVKCSDGRTIVKDSFKHNDGRTVPLVWQHQHNECYNVLGHALLEYREEGVYAHCSFNESSAATHAREMVSHGDITALSIYANQLKQNGGNVIHGEIREVSLVMAGANPQAFIDNVICHGEQVEEEAIIYTGENFALSHSSDPEFETDPKPKAEEGKKKEEAPQKQENEDETVGDVYASMSEKQKEATCYMIAKAYEESEKNNKNEDSEGGPEMKHNLFEQAEETNDTVLSHGDQASILEMAKSNSVGSFQAAMSNYMEANKLAHGFEDVEALFPEFRDIRPGAPELIQRDQSWVPHVMGKVHKTPFSRIRTRQMDARDKDLRGSGFKKGNKKKEAGNMKLLKRTTDPKTVYRKDSLSRDDILDITDFDVVEYQYGVMKQNLNEEIAMAILIGDGRDDSDECKIEENHIRPIWQDDELFTIHVDVDIAAMKKELQGSNTSANFGENYIYAESVITAALYAREDYKGSGSLDFYCTPHLVNVMLLARDLNGRRIYNTVQELTAALNVKSIVTIEQFQGAKRTAKNGQQKELLGLFVNLGDYAVGATKGGEITRFSQFDIDFNLEKYLIETRLSGALTRPYSAIALEIPTGTASNYVPDNGTNDDNDDNDDV